MEKEMVERKKRISPKRKWVLVACFFGGFYFGLHCFYAGRLKRGFFYLFSLTGVVIYYSYILSFLSHHWLTSWLHLGKGLWFLLFNTFSSIVQHIPFLGWTAYFGTYLIYLFAFALLLAIFDFFAILFGRFRDGNGLRIVSEHYKKKYENEILYY